MSSAWKGGSNRPWRRIRQVRLAMDQYLCQLQYPGICTTRATQVHHTLGKGVSENLNDLRSACKPCNTKAGNPRGWDPPPQPRTQW